MSAAQEIAAILDEYAEDGSPLTGDRAVERVLEIARGMFGHDLVIVNGWIAAEYRGPDTAPVELEPVVDLRTLPGWDEVRAIALHGIPAYSAGNLARLAVTLGEMPAPRGEQPREITLAVRLPGLGEIAVGEMLWDPKMLEWTWRPGPAGPRSEDSLDYPFRDTQAPPSTVEVKP